MGFEWLSVLRMPEHLGKVLSVASLVVTLGFIVFGSRATPATEQKEEPARDTAEQELDKLSQKRTRKTFLSEDDDNDEHAEVPSMGELSRRRRALGNTQFMSDNEPLRSKPRREKLRSYADDQELDRLHSAIGRSLGGELPWA